MAEEGDTLASMVSGATLVLVGGVVESVLRLLERVLLGRVLPPDRFGEVNIAVIVMTFGTTVALLGYSHATTRYVSRFDDTRDVRGVWATALLVPGLLSLAVAGALVVGAGHMGALLFEGPDATVLVAVFAATIPLRVGFLVTVNAFRGFENARYKVYVKDIAFPLMRIGLVVGLFALGYGVLAVGYAYLLATAVVLVVAHVLLHRLVPLLGPLRLHAREMTQFAAPLVLSTMLAFLLVKTDTLVLGAFRSSHEVGLYAAVVPLVTGMLIMLRSFGFMYLPIASRLDAESDEIEEVDALYTTTTKWVYVLTFPAAVTFVAFPGDVLAVFFGEAYRPAWPALAILSAAYFINVLAGLNRDTLSAIGYTKVLLVGYLVAFGANLGLDLLLVPRLGVRGAALASASALVSLNVVLLGFISHSLDISPFSARNVRTFVSLPAVLGPPTFVLSRWVSLSVLTLLPFLVVVGLAAVAVVGLVGGLGPEDRVVLDILEDRTGRSIPLVADYLPAEQ